MSKLKKAAIFMYLDIDQNLEYVKVFFSSSQHWEASCTLQTYQCSTRYTVQTVTRYTVQTVRK